MTKEKQENPPVSKVLLGKTIKDEGKRYTLEIGGLTKVST